MLPWHSSCTGQVTLADIRWRLSLPHQPWHYQIRMLIDTCQQCVEKAKINETTGSAGISSLVLTNNQSEYHVVCVQCGLEKQEMLRCRIYWCTMYARCEQGDVHIGMNPFEFLVCVDIRT